MTMLRLVMFEECNRSCPGCCNDDWDLKNLDKIDNFYGFEAILLTGGEPMLRPKLVMETCAAIRKQTDTPIFMYTAKSKRALDLIAVLNWIDGITLTLHEQYDVHPFIELNQMIKLLPEQKSLRLHVFDNVDIAGVDTSGWSVKDNIKWIKDCPLPEGEVIMRLF